MTSGPSQPDRPKGIGPLDNDRRFRAPSRALKTFARLKKRLPAGRAFINEDSSVLRLYLSDFSFLNVDSTGRVSSSGGLATKAFFRYRLWLCEINPTKRRPIEADNVARVQDTAPRLGRAC